MGTLGGLAAVTALPAYASVTTNSYTIGTPSGAVTNVSVSPATATASVNTGFTVTFTSPAALSYSVPDTITIGDSTASDSVTATATNVDVISGSCLQTGSATTSASYGLRVTLTSSSCTIPAGSTVEVTFNATAPTTNFNFTVSTSENGTSTNSPTVVVSSAPPTLTVANPAGGVNTTYTMTSIGASNATGGSWATLTSPASVIELSASNAGLTWYTGTGGYAVTVTPSGGAAAADAVTGVTVGSANVVYLTLTTAVASGSTVSITALATNPTTGTTTVTLTPGNGTGGSFVGVGNPETTAAATFGTSVSSVSASVSPPVSGAAATWTVSFKATTADTGSITISEASGPTNFTGANSTSGGILVNDVTAGWHVVDTPGSATVTGGGDTIAVPLGGNTINAGDSVTVTLVDVVNPGSSTLSDIDVSTASDTVSAAAAAVTISVAGTTGVNVTVNPSTVGTVAVYTISNLYASAAFTGGSTANTIELTAPAGTVFPDNSADYTVTDSTTSTGSGGFTLLRYNAANDVVLYPTNSITSGDLLTLTVSDVINPSSSSSSYTMTLSGNVNGQTGVAPFPAANLTYPNGAIVNFSGTFYVFAGGHPFGIASPTVLAKVQAVDHAVVLKAAAGATLPTAAARAGTLITTNAVNANATIYAVGTDGELHGFATGAQFTSDGYDPALTVTVPNLGGMTAGSTAGAEGSVLTALATAADGAIVDSSGTYYVLDGGRAFGIPTPTGLATVRKVDMATPLTGTIGTNLKGATMSSGVLLTVKGIVYVAYVGDLFPFKAPAQLAKDGYGGTPAVTATTAGGVGIVTTYSGS